jgi:hypothetical protein
VQLNGVIIPKTEEGYVFDTDVSEGGWVKFETVEKSWSSELSLAGSVDTETMMLQIDNFTVQASQTINGTMHLDAVYEDVWIPGEPGFGGEPGYWERQLVEPAEDVQYTCQFSIDEQRDTNFSVPIQSYAPPLQFLRLPRIRRKCLY